MLGSRKSPSSPAGALGKVPAILRAAPNVGKRRTLTKGACFLHLPGPAGGRDPIWQGGGEVRTLSDGRQHPGEGQVTCHLLRGAALLKETRVGAWGRGGARGAPLILQKEDGDFAALGVFWWAPRLCSHPEAFPAAGPRVAGGGSVEVTAESESRQTMYASQRSSSSADPGVGWPAGTVQGALFSCLWQLDGLEIPKPLSSSAGRNH